MTTKPANVLTRFSDRVDDYVKYRPGYPAAVLEALQDQCGLKRSCVIADIGSGPGNFARLFVENGNQVFAVEPNPEMQSAGRQLLGSFPNYRSVDGRAEATGLLNGSVDFVTAAQAFHWFDWPRAKTEFRRILRPRGWVVLIWNDRGSDSNTFLREYEALLCKYGTDYKDVRHDNSYKDIGGFFENRQQKVRFRNRQMLNFEGLRGRLLSSSYAPGADDSRREPMLRELQRLFDKYNQNGQVSFDYEVRIFFGQLG
jgi:SAM-dependent methyltransferase